jgi:hypothetical protein
VDGVDFQSMLNACPGSSTVRYVPIEYRLGGLTTLDGFCCGVCLLFVRIAWTSHAIGKFGPITLLHDVSCFMGGKIDVRLAAERDAIAGRVRKRAHVLVCHCRIAADGGTGIADVMASERGLDAVTMR